MTFLRASEGIRPSGLRRMAVSFVSSLVISTVISATLFSPDIAHAEPKPPRNKTRSAATIRVETARLRQGPGESHQSKALLDKGRDARIVGRRDGWVKLRLQTGTEGWVRSDLVKVSQKAVPDSDDSRSRSSRSKSSRKSAKSASAKKQSSKSTVASRAASSRWSRAKAAKTAAAKPKPAPKAAVKVAAAKPAPPARMPFLRATSLRTSPKIAAEVAEAKKAIAVQEADETPETVKALPETSAAETVVASAAPVETPVVALEASDVTPEAGSTTAPAMIATDNRAERLLRSAYSYRGTPYRMGANGRGAFDCSSFIKQIMKEQGMAMPRTAAEQYRKGTPVEKSQMQKGDLVFFKNTYKRGVSHVGMYIGDGKFIHASSRGGVRVDNLSESYYVNHWAGARRPNW